uniref:Uncharacterized protein n=1 Tax=Stomoxys calcitrans TaxID=35570 RepID=A0A1I8NT24_STOCA
MVDSGNQISMDHEEVPEGITSSHSSQSAEPLPNSADAGTQDIMVKWRKAMKSAYKAQLLLQEVMQEISQQVRKDKGRKREKNNLQGHCRRNENRKHYEPSKWQPCEKDNTTSSSSSSSSISSSPSSDSEVEIISWREKSTASHHGRHHHHGRRHHHGGRDRSHSRGRDRSRSRGHSRGRSRGHSRGHSRGRSRGHSRGHSATRDLDTELHKQLEAVSNSGHRRATRSRLSTHTIEKELPMALTL